MFHVASAALNSPARSPTRGSGLGGRMLVFIGAVPSMLEAPDDLHADTPAAAATSSALKREMLRTMLIVPLRWVEPEILRSEQCLWQRLQHETHAIDLGPLVDL